jgi:hypothetical protein
MREHTLFRPLRVLIADDCHASTDSLALLLRLWGHEPVVATPAPRRCGLP